MSRTRLLLKHRISTMVLFRAVFCRTFRSAARRLALAIATLGFSLATLGIAVATLGIAVATLGGCTWIKGASQPERPKTRLSIGEAAPFKLEVLEEVNDGETLHIVGAVAAATRWNVETVVVKLTGIHNGEVAGVSYLPLVKAARPGPDFSHSIPPDERFMFSLSIPSKDLTDYQIELVWGDEAARYLAPKQGPGTLEVRELEVETRQIPCAVGACDLTFVITGKLFNAGATAIDRAVLGVGYVEGGLTLGPDEAAVNEQQLEIPDLLLQPGDSRPFRLDLDRAVPQSSNMRPRLRIVEYRKAR